MCQDGAVKIHLKPPVYFFQIGLWSVTKFKSSLL